MQMDRLSVKDWGMDMFYFSFLLAVCVGRLSLRFSQNKKKRIKK